MEKIKFATPDISSLEYEKVKDVMKFGWLTNDPVVREFEEKIAAKSIGRIAVIADAAHSFGATLNGRVFGEFADFTCFSFYILKNLTTG